MTTMTSHYLHTLDEYFENVKNKGNLEWIRVNHKLSGWDIVALVILFAFITILRFFAVGIHTDLIGENSILYGLSRKSLLDRINKKWDIAKDGCIYKWKENCWFALWHSFSFLYNFLLLIFMSGYMRNKNGWVKKCLEEPTGKWFLLVTEDEYMENKRGWPYMYIDNSVHYFYLLEIAFWSSCLFYLKYEIRRKDFYVFILHHLSTILLLVYSHVFNFWRMGLLVLFVHDVVDVALYISKSLNYSNPRYQKTLTFFYIFFVFSYFFFRIIIFFFYIVIPLSNLEIIKSYTDGFITSYMDVPAGIVPLVLLWMLMVMHFYWFFLILKMTRIFIVKTMKNEDFVDIRSEDEGENPVPRSVPQKGK
ncbi:translocation associated membrane protein, putative [Plasmodium vivax]|nr:translocation associated membrane protein, putative [Plasmodium vivax]